MEVFSVCIILNSCGGVTFQTSTLTLQLCLGVTHKPDAIGSWSGPVDSESVQKDCQQVAGQLFQLVLDCDVCGEINPIIAFLREFPYNMDFYTQKNNEFLVQYRSDFLYKIMRDFLVN